MLDHVETWVFDLDDTLYPARYSLFDQVVERIGSYIEATLEVDKAEARRLQTSFHSRYGTTLNGLMLEHGVDPRDFLDYVHDIDYSAIPADPALDRALAVLPGRKLIFTNGDVPHAERVTERLGVDHHFEEIFDIVASDYVPKPEQRVYESFVNRFGIAARHTAMFEDIARNLAPAKALGMATVWVRNEADWQKSGAGDGHVDHVADGLTAWLGELAEARRRG